MEHKISYSEAAECCCDTQLDAWVAKYAPGKTELTVQEIFDLAMESTDNEKASLVIYLEPFPMELAMRLAETCGAYAKGRIARYSSLPRFFRRKLALECSPEWRAMLKWAFDEERELSEIERNEMRLELERDEMLQELGTDDR